MQILNDFNRKVVSQVLSVDRSAELRALKISHLEQDLIAGRLKDEEIERFKQVKDHWNPKGCHFIALCDL